MSNLGMYQAITTAAKAVGGPKNLIVLIAVGGYAGGKIVEMGTKKVLTFVKTKVNKEELTEGLDSEIIYKVVNEVTDEQGLTLKPDDELRILAKDNDVVLIEKIGDDNNPYYVSLEFIISAIAEVENEENETEESEEEE